MECVSQDLWMQQYQARVPRGLKWLVTQVFIALTTQLIIGLKNSFGGTTGCLGAIIEEARRERILTRFDIQLLFLNGHIYNY